MIQITERQHLIYELLQRGIKNIKEISLLVGKGTRCIRREIEFLENNGMVVVKKNGASLDFIVIKTATNVKSKVIEDTTQKKLRRIVPDLTGYDYNFTDQQRLDMFVYKKSGTYDGETMPRTLFAKKLGVRKLYVNIALGAMS